MNNNNSRFSSTPAALILLLTAFLPSAITASETHSTDILFLAYDQGESNAFIHIQEQLDKRDIPYKIIAFGRAAELFKHHPALVNIEGISDNSGLRYHRETRAPEKSLKKALESIQARVIYSGMASRIQAQLLNLYGQQGSFLVAFYDNFDPIETKEYTQSFLEEVHRVDEFHLPSDLTATSFENLKKAKKAKTVITGQPTLEGWDQIFNNTNPASLRKKLDIAPDQPVVLFAGGYDGDYPNSFRIFLKAAKQMSDTLFVVTHHPKHSGELEQELINKEGIRNIRLLHKHQASTPELCTIAKAVVVHKSTIAQQALYKGKPVVYVADSSFSNFILKKQMASRVYTPEDLHKTLSEILALKKNQNTSLDTLGVPKNPSRKISDRLQKLLKKRDKDQ